MWSTLKHSAQSAVGMSAKDQDAEAAAAASAASAHVGGMRSRVDVPQGTPEHLAIAREYSRARMAGDTAALMRIISPDIVFVSQRDGAHRGADAFLAYIRRTPIEGTWGEPHLDPQSGLVRFDGRIKYLKLVPITVKGVFRFGRDGRIAELFVGKA